MNLRCPTCGKRLLIERDGDKRVLRTRIVIFDNGTCFAKCPLCKNKVIVPIKLLDEFMDGLAEQERGTADRVRASSGAVRERPVVPFEQLARELEKLFVPFTNRVRAMLGNGGKRVTQAQLEKLRECRVQIRQLDDLIERLLQARESGAAVAGPAYCGKKVKNQIVRNQRVKSI